MSLFSFEAQAENQAEKKCISVSGKEREWPCECTFSLVLDWLAKMSLQVILANQSSTNENVHSQYHCLSFPQTETFPFSLICCLLPL